MSFRFLKSSLLSVVLSAFVASAAVAQKAPEKAEIFPVKNGSVKISNGAVFFDNWILNDFSQEKKNKEGKRVDLSYLTQTDKGSLQFYLDSREYAYLGNVSGSLERQGDTGYLWAYEDDKIKITREYKFDESQYYVDVVLRAELKDGAPEAKYGYLSLEAFRPEDETNPGMFTQMFATDFNSIERGFYFYGADDVEEVSTNEYLDSDFERARVYKTPAKWMAARNQYFALAAMVQGEVLPKIIMEPLRATNGGRMSMRYPLVSGKMIEIPMRVFFGAQQVDVLGSIDPSLERVVNLGFFTFISVPLMWLMKYFFSVTGNWGIAIIFITILLKILTYPLTYKGMKSMKKMAALQPKLQKLRERYKDDPQKLNQEMIGFMRNNGYNPLSGCLPLLVQMPVFFALFQVLRSSVELYQAPFFLWIQDLTFRDPYFVTPILMTVTMVLQQKITPNTATDPTQKKIIQYMPVFFGVIMLNLPAGLTIYMLANAVTGILQQFILNKKLDVAVPKAANA